MPAVRRRLPRLNQTGWSIRKFVRTARRYRTIEIRMPALPAWSVTTFSTKSFKFLYKELQGHALRARHGARPDQALSVARITEEERVDEREARRRGRVEGALVLAGGSLARCL